MGMNDPDLSGPKIQLEVLRERQKHFEDKIRQLEQELAQAYTNLGRREREIEQIKVERESLKIKWEVLKQDYQHVKDLLAQNGHKAVRKKSLAKIQAFVVSLIFLISSVLVNVGTSMFTTAPPNPSLAWLMIVLAATVYIIATLMTTLLVSDGGN